MAVIQVQRKPLSFAERTYLPQVFGGLMTTLRLATSRQMNDTRMRTASVAPLRCREKKPSKRPGMRSALHVEVLGVLFPHEAFEKLAGSLGHAQQGILGQDDRNARFLGNELGETLEERAQEH